MIALPLCLYAVLARAQPASDTPAPATPAQPDAPVQDAGTASLLEAAGSLDAAAQGQEEPAPEAEAEPEPPRGDIPISAEEIVTGREPAPVQQPAPPTEPTPKPPGGKPSTPKPAVVEPKPPAPLVVWATAGWATALGSARCTKNPAEPLEGVESALRIGSILKQSAAVAGFGLSSAGALSDHPLLEYAAQHEPGRLADLIVSAGFSSLAVGVSDMTGPLLREPQLAAALKQRGVQVAASNLVCGGAAWCRDWATAEDPLPIFERDGRRYALIALLPDDLLARVEPVAGRRFQLQPALETLIKRTQEAQAAGADLIVASIDQGPDATAAVNLANFLAQLPPDVRPDLLLSPSSGDNLLFLRPLDVQPAVVGTRRGVLTGVRVTKLDNRDADVFARSVQLSARDDGLAAQLQALGSSFCNARAQELPGGRLDVPMSNESFVELAGAAAREVANADLALVDPLAYERMFAQPAGVRLQRAQIERAVVFDAPLVVANVTLDWLGNLNKVLTGLRPLTLIGSSTEAGDALIAGRLPVTGALYRVVTSAVLARSDRLPGGVSWSPVTERHATLRGALLHHLSAHSDVDPRVRVDDPMLGTQWVLRADGQVFGNLTSTSNKSKYPDEPSLQVNNSFQLGGRLVVNFDADAPRFLFENLAQIGFDRNFTTNTTAQDLIVLQTTYTYRGLWPKPLWYPHPFIEGYGESEFDQGDAQYHHVLLRTKLGLRAMSSRVLSLKVSAGFQREVGDPNAKVNGGVGAEIVLKPWTVALENGTLQLEGNVMYYWNAPGLRDQHTVRGTLISSIQLIGPLQFTLSALGTLRKNPGEVMGAGIGLQAGVRLRFVSRSMFD
ncbi:MAG: hypothetical protein RL701_5047 [Pseudomonadota bacterium]